jgi:hypothetical protein
MNTFEGTPGEPYEGSGSKEAVVPTATSAGKWMPDRSLRIIPTMHRIIIRGLLTGVALILAGIVLTQVQHSYRNGHGNTVSPEEAHFFGYVLMVFGVIAIVSGLVKGYRMR